MTTTRSRRCNRAPHGSSDRSGWFRTTAPAEPCILRHRHVLKRGPPACAHDLIGLAAASADSTPLRDWPARRTSSSVLGRTPSCVCHHPVGRRCLTSRASSARAMSQARGQDRNASVGSSHPAKGSQMRSVPTLLVRTGSRSRERGTRLSRGTPDLLPRPLGRGCDMSVRTAGGMLTRTGAPSPRAGGKGCAADQQAMRAFRPGPCEGGEGIEEARSGVHRPPLPGHGRVPAWGRHRRDAAAVIACDAAGAVVDARIRGCHEALVGILAGCRTRPLSCAERTRRPPAQSGPAAAAVRMPVTSGRPLWRQRNRQADGTSSAHRPSARADGRTEARWSAVSPARASLQWPWCPPVA
ncbi:hypothetical protein M2163_000740 [Streptomyces sp. SAI-135]|nr:hypothetical protein [Streptomyces sp. SAI-090]MDH6554375.1 hypothetical protein [Streptomyces sp. SAI-041]MDH6581626.1 hypothetical protein [Streptomyces sp. SAI-133]MDH6613632.1 hypothetical protein [Streptomyces sp. SAI-135]